MDDPGVNTRLNLPQRLFMLGCYPPPGRSIGADGHGEDMELQHQADPMGRVRKVFGKTFEEALQGRVFLDLGCGVGHQTLAAVKAGAALAVGVDIVEKKFARTAEQAAASEWADRIKFTAAPLRSLGEDWVDVALSQNSFEHFRDPAAILADVRFALKPGGRFFITFGPPWKHPYGVHHYFMIKWPWMHMIFSERTIMETRKMYRSDAPRNYIECSLNQMTISKFESLVKESGFTLTELRLTPIGAVPKPLRGLCREYTTSHVSAILTK